MKNVIVVAATQYGKELTFSVICENKEILYGKVKWKIYDDVKLDIRAECYERNGHSEYYGFTEMFYTDPAEYIWRLEEHQNECIRKVVKKAMPETNITEIINI